MSMTRYNQLTAADLLAYEKQIPQTHVGSIPWVVALEFAVIAALAVLVCLG